jgi:hypothetical protein
MEYRMMSKDYDGRTHFQRVRDGLVNRKGSTDFGITLAMFITAAAVAGAAIAWVL